jgi:hypothetical protein
MPVHERSLRAVITFDPEEIILIFTEEESEKSPQSSSRKLQNITA